MDLPGRTTEDTDGYERLARKGLAAYGLSDARISLVSQKERVVFSVIDDGPDGREVYALRISGRDESKKQLLRESLFLEWLRRGLVENVPEPVLTRKGELIQSLSTPGVSGFRLVSLLRWVGGRQIPTGDWTEKIARSVGRLIGEIHRCSEGFEWPDELRPDGVPERIPQVDPATPSSDRDTVEKAVKLARRTLASLAGDPKSEVISHADLTPEHLLFSGGGVGAIGFSSCRVGYYLYDLASVALEIDEPLWEGLVSGYREIRPIDADRLERFIALRALDILSGPARGRRRPLAVLRDLAGRG